MCRSESRTFVRVHHFVMEFLVSFVKLQLRGLRRIQVVIKILLFIFSRIIEIFKTDFFFVLVSREFFIFTKIKN